MVALLLRVYLPCYADLALSVKGFVMSAVTAQLHCFAAGVYTRVHIGYTGIHAGLDRRGVVTTRVVTAQVMCRNCFHV